MDAAGHIVVVDSGNHALRRVFKAGEVSTLAGNGEAGFADGQGAAARFNKPAGLARDKDGSILVSDNNAVRRVTMEGAVSTVAGNGEAGYADGEGDSRPLKIQPSKLTVLQPKTLSTGSSCAGSAGTPTANYNRPLKIEINP